MITWIIIDSIILLIIVFVILRTNYELYHLKTAFYSVESEKIGENDSLRMVFLSDLHGRSYGTDNEALISRIAEAKPDLILTAGDMVTATSDPGFSQSEELFRKLLEISPVYSSYGNHEKRMSMEGSIQHEEFMRYRDALEEAGVHWLTNTGSRISKSVSVYGLDIDYRYYRKVRRIFYETDQMKQDLASVSKECFNIVLAHNPRFFQTYAEYGADLYLSGHYHGGTVRIGKGIGLISPQFRLFPRYSRGEYREGHSRMIVSAGCGTHKVNLRLFNKPEVVVIDLHGHSI